jgi:hypothetical protein
MRSPVKDARRSWEEANPEKVLAIRRRWYFKHWVEHLARARAERARVKVLRLARARERLDDNSCNITTFQDPGPGNDVTGSEDHSSTHAKSDKSRTDATSGGIRLCHRMCQPD